MRAPRVTGSDAKRLGVILDRIPRSIAIDGESKVEPRQPPAVGQHSDEVLRKFGCDEAEIGRLRASGTVR